MREIKFRAKAVSSGEWVYGNFIHSARFKGCGNEFRIHEPETGLEHDVDPETVGQLTGLKDKNGTDIWEGDTLKGFSDYPSSYEVWHHDGCFRLRYKMREGTFYDWGYLHRIFEIIDMYAEVTGNIHDNPSLIP